MANSACPAEPLDQLPEETPAVFGASSVPRHAPNYAVVFRFNTGEIRLSAALFRLLGAAVEDTRRVALVNFKGSWYITVVGGENGFWINATTKNTKRSYSICSRYFVHQTMREMGHGPDDAIVFPVAIHPVAAEDVRLRSSDFPNPFYRLVSDQKYLKSK